MELGKTRDRIVISQGDKIELVGIGVREQIGNLPHCVGMDGMTVEVATIPAGTT